MLKTTGHLRKIQDLMLSSTFQFVTKQTTIHVQ